jgi:hypothetical protein
VKKKAKQAWNVRVDDSIDRDDGQHTTKHSAQSSTANQRLSQLKHSVQQRLDSAQSKDNTT